MKTIAKTSSMRCVMDKIEKYKEYAKGVINGNIVSGEYIKLACERYLSWFQRDDIFFDSNAVDRVINFISKLKKSNTDMGSAKTLGENANVVRIMSIHKSKGLEYSICYFTGLSKRSNDEDKKAKFIVDSNYNIIIS